MIKGRLVLKGEVTLQSPAIIGCGKDENTDIDLLKDADGIPYIPATSLIGVLRSAIKPNGVNVDKFWGYTKDKESIQSVIKCEDLRIINSDNNNTEIRDGIKINPKTGIVEKGAKYDYEIIPAGKKFDLFMEASYTDYNKITVLRMLKTIEKGLTDGMISIGDKTIEKGLTGEMISIGAKTNSGFGKIKLNNSAIYDFDFSQKSSIYYWLTKELNDSLKTKDIEPYTIVSRDFIINVTLRLKTSLIIRSYSEDPDAPDAVHMKSGGVDIIPGTSLKGAIRARAERIVNTIKGSHSEIIDAIFGYVFDDEKEAEKKNKKKGDAYKGRITIDEVTLPRFVSEIQTRIKIDRFTGGTIEAALLENMPLFSSPKDETIKNIKIKIKDYKPHEAGLMLLVLKDLFTGDIAIGGEKGIGRGVFEGIEAEIKHNGKSIKINKDLTSLTAEEKQELEVLVSGFINHSGGSK